MDPEVFFPYRPKNRKRFDRCVRLNLKLVQSGLTLYLQETFSGVILQGSRDVWRYGWCLHAAQLNIFFLLSTHFLSPTPRREASAAPDNPNDVFHVNAFQLCGNLYEARIVGGAEMPYSYSLEFSSNTYTISLNAKTLSHARSRNNNTHLPPIPGLPGLTISTPESQTRYAPTLGYNLGIRSGIMKAES
ncbi:hypothetical protein K440DRAFT_645316 [Wilcoxina mikolae CBS 423.85]|nr:hypothetical protein K440DRAFT_645316 [Wilcoxina mikolae CBS 423.85]